MFIFTEKKFRGSIFYATGSLPFLLHCDFRKKKSVLNAEYASKVPISVTICNMNQTTPSFELNKYYAMQM
jgi:hypothetical protein